MPRIYNKIGSLTALKQELSAHNIHDFHSLKEVLDFKHSFPSIRDQLIVRHRKMIEEEKVLIVKELEMLDVLYHSQKEYAETILRHEIDELNDRIQALVIVRNRNILSELISDIKLWFLRKKLNNRVVNFDNNVLGYVDEVVQTRNQKNERQTFINAEFDLAVQNSSTDELTALDRKKSIVDGLSSLIYGSIGEQKVVDALKVLPDDHILINDFSLSFSPSIYNRKEKEYIRSIQVDHILVSPSGIFLIETKNWSEESINSTNLRSPIAQVKRYGFVLYSLLNGQLGNSITQLKKHHWGEKKIPVRNIVVLVQSKPIEEFQYVRILSLNELVGYIQYFKPIFNIGEVLKIADDLLDINQTNTN